MNVNDRVLQRDPRVAIGRVPCVWWNRHQIANLHLDFAPAGERTAALFARGDQIDVLRCHISFNDHRASSSGDQINLCVVRMKLAGSRLLSCGCARTSGGSESILGCPLEMRLLTVLELGGVETGFSWLRACF